jgi:hypothetical protein
LGLSSYGTCLLNKFYIRTKHIDLRYHFEDGKIMMKYIPTLDNIMDIFTKVLLEPKFTEFVAKLGLAMMKE